MLKKYLSIIEKSLIVTLEYRAEILLWIFISIIPFGVILIIWSTIYGQSAEINNFSLSNIIQYYLLVMIIRRFTASHFEDGASQDIREGKIDHILCKPISYTKLKFLKILGNRISSILITSPVLVMMIYFFIANSESLFLINYQALLIKLIFFIFLLINGYLIEWLFAYLTVLFSFWYENASGLQNFKMLLITILSGSMIPIPFMPDFLQNLVDFLPFKYLYAVPIAVIQNNYLLTIFDFVYILLFLVVLRLATLVVWKKGILKYSSAGG